jgi:Cu+-exporting ATPase
MSTNHSIGFHGMTDGPRTTRDPVCRGEISVDDAAAEETYAGQTYYFCSSECAEAFRTNPSDYLPGPAQA